MKKFISLSKYPGRHGQYFYTKFFEHYNIDAVYEPRGTDDLVKSLHYAIEEQVSGISISMPFKNEVIKFLDDTTSYVDIYNSCNTIRIEDGQLIGFNTDISGVEWACKHINGNDKITILGNGAMASTFVKCLEHDYYGNINIASRRFGTWNRKDLDTDVIINATSLGTSTDQSPYDVLPKNVRLVIDLAIKDNQLKQQCLAAGVKYLSGKDFYKQQFLNQFEIYTGIKPDSNLFDEFERQQHERV